MHIQIHYNIYYYSSIYVYSCMVGNVYIYICCILYDVSIGWPSPKTTWRAPASRWKMQRAWGPPPRIMALFGVSYHTLGGVYCLFTTFLIYIFLCNSLYTGIIIMYIYGFALYILYTLKRIMCKDCPKFWHKLVLGIKSRALALERRS